MKRNKRFYSKPAMFSLLFMCFVFIVLSFVAIYHYVQSFNAPDATLHVLARNNTGYSVHYVDNDIFGNGARPANQNYLVSFTDYIEFENSFRADFSQEVEVAYQYSALAVLMIKYQKGSDDNINPVVYEEKFTLSEISGHVKRKQISFNGRDDNTQPGGVYRIDPKSYIDIYRRFVKEQREQMYRENVLTGGALNFSAELKVDFSLHISDNDSLIDETLTRGFLIPLTNEVFSVSETGTSSLETSVPVREFKMPGFWLIIPLVLWFVVNILGICHGIRQLTMEKDAQRREVKRILKTYSDEIIISLIPIDLSGYKAMPVFQFRDLLKLAMNMNKCILCFHNEEKAEFCVVADGYVYCYNICFADE